MRHTQFGLLGLTLLVLPLAACKEETPPPQAARAPAPAVSPTVSPTVSVANLGSAQWPAIDAGAEISAVDSGASPFAENNMVVLDMSGSMDDENCSGEHINRAEAAKTALLTWIAANPGDNFGLVSFSGGRTTLDLPLGRGEAHAAAIVDRIQTLQPGGGTPLLSSMTMAYGELTKQAVRQGGTGSYRLIVITDGAASEGENPVGLIHTIAANPADMVEVHTIGFCISGRHSLKDPDRVFYTDANSPEALRAGLDATQGEAADFDTTTTTFEDLQQ